VTAADLHILTGAYALGALDPAENEAFRQHLTGCELCAQEVRELEETAARLGAAAASSCPPELRAQVLRRIGTVRQLPPLLPPGPGPEPVRRLSRGYRFALAASLVAAAALGSVSVWQYQQARAATGRAVRTQQQADAVTAVLTAGDARATSGRLSDGAGGTVVVSRQLDQAVFLTPGLPALPAHRVYQLWYDQGGAMRPAGLVHPGAGSQAVLLRGPVGGAQGLGVTVEPEGGSTRPTTAPLGLLGFAGAA
jgi:anti-sigma factor RsiW